MMHITKSRRGRVAVLLVAALLVTAVACGGDSGGGSSSPSTGGGGGGSGGEPIRVGFVSDLTGAYGAVFGPAADGARAYVESLNAAGGVDGRMIEMEVYDTKSDVTEAINGVRRAVSEGVYAIVGTSVFIDGAMSYLSQQELPVVGFGASGGWYEPGTEENIFSWVGRIVGKTSTAWTEFFLDQGLEKLAVVADSTPASAQAGTQWVEMAQGIGADVVYSELSFDATDLAALSAVAQRIKDSGAQGVLSTMGAGNVQLQAALNQLGAGISVLSGGEYSPSVPEQFGTSADGYVAATFFAPFQSDGVAGLDEYLEVMDQYAPDQKLDSWAATAYISMAMFVEGLRQAGVDATAAEYNATMNEMDGWDLDGFIAPVHFPLFHSEPAGCLGFSELGEGEWVSVGQQLPMTCGEPFPPS